MKGHIKTWQTYNKLMHEDTISWAVLWLVCRHHIGELPMEHVDIHIRGPRALKQIVQRLFLLINVKSYVPNQIKIWVVNYII